MRSFWFNSNINLSRDGVAVRHYPAEIRNPLRGLNSPLPSILDFVLHRPFKAVLTQSIVPPQSQINSPTITLVLIRKTLLSTNQWSKLDYQFDFNFMELTYIPTGLLPTIVLLH